MGWTHSVAGEFVPVDRQYAHDRALLATSIGNNEPALTTPLFTSDRDMLLTFEFAMETEKEAAMGGEGQLLMQGYEPGIFGDDDYFHIIYGDEVLREIREYDGTMTPTSLGGNEDGSSTFVAAEVDIPASEEPRAVTFLFSSNKKSRLFIRNIRLEQTGEPTSADRIADTSHVSVTGETEVYNAAGMRVKVSDLSRLPAGLYIVNGKKVLKHAGH